MEASTHVIVMLRAECVFEGEMQMYSHMHAESFLVIFCLSEGATVTKGGGVYR